MTFTAKLDTQMKENRNMVFTFGLGLIIGSVSGGVGLALVGAMIIAVAWFLPQIMDTKSKKEERNED